MRAWIQFTQQRYINEDVERQWGQYNLGDNDKLSWETYRQMVYGFLDDEKPEEGQEEAFKEEQLSYKYVGLAATCSLLPTKHTNNFFTALA